MINNLIKNNLIQSVKTLNSQLVKNKSFSERCIYNTRFHTSTNDELQEKSFSTETKKQHISQGCALCGSLQCGSSERQKDDWW